MTEKGPQNIDEIVRTLFKSSNRPRAFHLPQELSYIHFQTNTKDFQSQGN